MARLTPSQIADALSSLPGWTANEGRLEATMTFAGFVQAVAFVNRVAALAEAAAHHPDIDIRYSRVRISLTTYDEGGVTDRDVQLARQIAAAVAG